MILSIVTITYKDSAGFAATCASLRELSSIKNFPAWEHIVIDASPSENAGTIGSLSSAWPLRYFESEPRGSYQAQNDGLKQAKGKYVWFLNGGDKCADANAVCAALEEAEKVDAEIIFAPAEAAKNGVYQYTAYIKRNFVCNLIGSNHVCHQAMLYRRSVFEKLGEFTTSYKLAADYEHSWRCYLAGIKAHHFKRALCTYDMSGISSNVSLVMREFRQVQVALPLPFGLRVLNFLFWHIEYLRICLLKKIGSTRFGALLRPIWLSWRR